MRTHLVATIRATTAPLDFVDVTDDVAGALDESGIENGHVTVFAPDADCSLIVNERESGLWHDLRGALARTDTRLAPERRAVLGSSSVVLPALEGRLHLGTWQRVLLVELGEPCHRRVSVQVVGE